MADEIEVPNCMVCVGQAYTEDVCIRLCGAQNGWALYKRETEDEVEDG